MKLLIILGLLSVKVVAQAQEGQLGGFLQDLLKNLFAEKPLQDQREIARRPTGGISSKQRRQCSKSPDPGRCGGDELMYYYNSFNNQCQRFIYTGCGGNQNRFRNARDCVDTCIGSVSSFPSSRRASGLVQSDAIRGPGSGRGGGRPREPFLQQGQDGSIGFDMKKLQGFGQLGVGILRAIRTPGPYRGSFGVCGPETCPEFYTNVDKFKDNLDDTLLDIQTAGEISQKEGGTEFIREVMKNRKNGGSTNRDTKPLTRTQKVARERTIDYYDQNDS